MSAIVLHQFGNNPSCRLSIYLDYAKVEYKLSKVERALRVIGGIDFKIEKIHTARTHISIVIKQYYRLAKKERQSLYRFI